MSYQNENGSIDLSTIHPSLRSELEHILLLNEKLNNRGDYDFIQANCSTYTYDENFNTYPLNRNRFVTFYCKGIKEESSQTLLFYKFESIKTLEEELLLLEEIFKLYDIKCIHLVFDKEEELNNTYRYIHSLYSKKDKEPNKVNYILGCEKEPFIRIFSN